MRLLAASIRVSYVTRLLSGGLFMGHGAEGGGSQGVDALLADGPQIGGGDARGGRAEQLRCAAESGRLDDAPPVGRLGQGGGGCLAGDIGVDAGCGQQIAQPVGCVGALPRSGGAQVGCFGHGRIERCV